MSEYNIVYFPTDKKWSDSLVDNGGYSGPLVISRIPTFAKITDPRGIRGYGLYAKEPNPFPKTLTLALEKVIYCLDLLVSRKQRNTK